MKIKWFLIGLLALGLSGCGKPAAAAQPASDKILNQPENIWHDLGSWTDGHYTAQAASVAPTVMVSTHGEFVGYPATRSYAEVKTALQQQGTTKFYALKTLNAALTQAKAGIALRHLSDLTLPQLPGSSPTTTGYVAHGHRLYAIAIAGTAKTPSVTVYANTGKVGKAVTTRALAGRWVGADGSQQRVMGDMLYRNDTLGASRVKLLKLSALSASKLYTATYLQRLALAAQQGYRLSKATTTVATDGTTLYLFLSQTRMVAITATGVTTYRHTNAGTDTSRVKADILAVFKAADARKDLLPAMSVANIGSSHYEVACHAMSQLTDTYSSKDIDWQKATKVGSRITIADMYPELK